MDRNKSARALLEAKYLPSFLSKLAINAEESKRFLQKTFRSLCELEGNRIRHQVSFSIAKDNKNLNRYIDILPFDHNRITIRENDYINASYLNSIDGAKRYIATQGPLPNTIGDFWQMVWEQQSSVIVMLTKVEESGKIKCEKYWPNLGSLIKFGRLDVRLKTETRLQNIDGNLREFELSDGKNSRNIKQIHYLGWPDHNISDSSDFLRLLDLVNHYDSNSKGPLIVHCSAGCGRTATFCTIDACLDMIKNPKPVSNSKDWDFLPENDLVAYQVNQFRKDRISSVQTVNQFIFCYDVILQRLFDWHANGIPCSWNTE